MAVASAGAFGPSTSGLSSSSRSNAQVEQTAMSSLTNLVFSKWDQIFKDPTTTAAAIDRVVHHAVVLEFLGPSLRSEVAEERARAASTKRNAAPPADA